METVEIEAQVVLFAGLTSDRLFSVRPCRASTLGVDWLKTGFEAVRRRDFEGYHRIGSDGWAGVPPDWGQLI